MGIDLFIVSCALVAGFLGAMTGAAKQIANLVGVVAVYFLARPIGAAIGPHLAVALHQSQFMGTVAGTFVTFIVLVIVVRWVVKTLLQKVLSGGNPENRGLDRGLGFLMAAAKVGVIAWVTICALVFVEDNVSLAGRRVGLSPKGSVAFDLARRYNAFELSQLSAVRDFAKVAKAAQDPKREKKLEDLAAFQRLKKDPKYVRALSQKGVKQAATAGNDGFLMDAPGVMELVADPQTQTTLHEIASTLE